jgi:hypothetical protein
MIYKSFSNLHLFIKKKIKVVISTEKKNTFDYCIQKTAIRLNKGEEKQALSNNPKHFPS